MEAQEQGPYPVPQAYGIGHTSDTALQLHLDTQDIIDHVKHTLKCEHSVINPHTGMKEWTRPPGMRPLLNDVGVNTVVFLLESYLNKIFQLSNLDEEMINNMAREFEDTLIDDLTEHWDDYELQSITTASFIRQTIGSMYLATLRKAKDGGYLVFFRSVQTINEFNQVNKQSTGEGKTFFERLFKKK